MKGAPKSRRAIVVGCFDFRPRDACDGGVVLGLF